MIIKVSVFSLYRNGASCKFRAVFCITSGVMGKGKQKKET